MSITQVDQGFEQAEKLVNAQVAQGVELFYSVKWALLILALLRP